jgi:hypothetical protein
MIRERLDGLCPPLRFQATFLSSSSYGTVPGPTTVRSMTRIEMRPTIKKKRGATFDAIYFQRARAAPGGPCVWSSVRLGRPNRQPAIPTAAPPKTAFSIVYPRSEPLLSGSCRSCGRRSIGRADRYCALPSRLPVIENESAGVNRDSLKRPWAPRAASRLFFRAPRLVCVCVCVCVCFLLIIAPASRRPRRASARPPAATTAGCCTRRRCPPPCPPA